MPRLSLLLFLPKRRIFFFSIFSILHFLPKTRKFAQSSLLILSFPINKEILICLAWELRNLNWICESLRILLCWLFFHRHYRLCKLYIHYTKILIVFPLLTNILYTYIPNWICKSLRILRYWLFFFIHIIKYANYTYITLKFFLFFLYQKTYCIQ